MAERYFVDGVRRWEDVARDIRKYQDRDAAKPTDNIPEEKAAKLRERGQSALELFKKAVSLRSDFAEPWRYLSFLYRELVKLETDAKAKDQLLEQAREAHDKYLEIKESKPESSSSWGEEPEESEPLEAVFPPSDLPKVPQVSGRLLLDNVIEQVIPEYPKDARELGVPGSIRVELVVDQDGKVIFAQALSGHPLLQAAAQEAARQWRFLPILLEGKPSRVRAVLIFNFRL